MTILLDASGDLGTGTAGARSEGPAHRWTARWGYAAVFAATLAWWLERQHEPVGLEVLGGTDVRWPAPAWGGRTFPGSGVLAETRPGGRAD